VGSVKGIWIGAIVLAAGAAVVAIVIARGGGTAAVTPPTTPSVKASLAPGAVEFGDPVTATVSVLADRADAVVVHQNLDPLTALGPTRVTRATRGRARVVTYTTRATCIDETCTGTARSQRFRLEPAHVEVGGRTETARWPVLVVHTRVSPADVAQAQPPVRSDATPPPVTYRVSPGSLARALEIVAAILAAAGVLVAGWSAAALYRRRARPEPLTGLERAIALAREAEGRPAPDRRRALGLLADTLGSRNPRLAGAADELAWSAPAPTTDAVGELVSEVEHEVNRDSR
jgi:hypothetical protein